MKSLVKSAVVLAVALVLITMPTISVTSVAAPIQRYYGYSLNWSGYAIVVGGEIAGEINKEWQSTSEKPIYDYTVSCVYGEWIVPEIGVGTTGYMADVGVWIGIDGYASGTVEQIGTSSEYNPYTGEINYYAWWEVYPKFSHRIRAMKVNPGDDIAAYVKFTPTGRSKKITDRGIFELSLTDLTTGRSFTIVQGPLQPGFYKRSSAEWVVERPGYYNPSTKQAYFAELAPFDDPVEFSSCRAVIVAPPRVDIHYDRIWMVAPYTGPDYGDAYGTSPPLYTIAETDKRDGDLITWGTFSVDWIPFGGHLAPMPWPWADPEGTIPLP